MTVKVFDFFSGCGGTSAGLRLAGMDITFALDNNADSALTFKANFPEAVFECRSIQSFAPADLTPQMESVRGQPTLFAGCAPCQPFSKQNKAQHRLTDERVNLLKYFGEFVEFHRPDYVLIENVPGLQSLDVSVPGPLPEFVELLNRLHYASDIQIVRSQDYGVPQRRARLILIASLHGSISLPAPTHGPAEGLAMLKPYQTAWEAIGHLPALRAGESHEDIPNHVCAQLTPLNLERIRHTPAGGDRRDWPEHLWLDCHKKQDDNNRAFDGHMDVYGRIKKHQPASGLTTRCISLSNGRFGHPDPEQHRALSVREAAYLQTFPSDFILEGTMTSTARQVGNAVPVLLAQRLGDQIQRHWNQIVQQRSVLEPQYPEPLTELPPFASL